MEDRMHSIDDTESIAGSRNLLSVFRRRLWVMLPVALVLIASALLYAAVQPRMYEASVWMLVTPGETRRGGMPLMTEQDVLRSLQADISMHRRLIRSAEIAERVRQELNVDYPIHALIDAVTVEQARGTSANVISIAFRSRDPMEAKQIADTWAMLYEQSSREQSTRSTVSAIDYVERQIGTVSGDLRDLEERMARLEQEYLTTGVNIASAEGGTRLHSLIGSIAENRIEMRAIEAQIERTANRLEEEPMELEETEEQPSYQAVAIEQQLSRLHVELQDKLQEYYDDSPEITALREHIARLEEQFEERSEMTRSAVTTQPNPVYLSAQDKLIGLYGQLDSLRARESALQAQLSEQQALSELVPAGSISYKEKAREAEGLQSVHSFLLSRLHELQLERAMAIAPVQVVREADTPRSPVSPQYQSIIGVGFIGAILLAALAAVVVDQIDDTFADPDEIRDVLDARLLGVLPVIDQERKETIQVAAGNGGTRNAFANATRMLASTVRIQMSRENLTSLTVTSAGRAEGKTIVAGNLAAAFASSDRRVLVIDADLHRPRLHTLLGTEREPGLSNLLVGDVTPEEVIKGTQIDNLSMISAGPLPPSPVDLFASAHGQELIERLNEMADYVIWDTPPAGFLADATVISHATERTLFVVGKQARRKAASETMQNLREIGVKPIGVVANQVRPTAGSYYYYYYYYQDYYREDD